VLSVFIFIIYNIALPIFLLIGLGFLFGRRFQADVRTMRQLLFYFISPTVFFGLIVDSQLKREQIVSIGSVVILQMLVLAVLAIAVFSLKPFSPHRMTMVFGAVFFNGANYGIPLTTLALGEQALDVITVGIMVNALTLITIGIPIMSASGYNLKEIFIGLAKVPMFYGLLAGLLVRVFGIEVPEPLMFVVTRLRGAFVPLALMTLGAQLALINPGKNLELAGASSFIRLLISPVVMTLLALVFHLDAPTSAALVLLSSTPIAVNTFVLASEYDRSPELASQMIFVSTVFSLITVPVVLSFFR